MKKLLLFFLFSLTISTGLFCYPFEDEIKSTIISIVDPRINDIKIVFNKELNSIKTQLDNKFKIYIDQIDAMLQEKTTKYINQLDTIFTKKSKDLINQLEQKIDAALKKLEE
ncbi:MAG: hypothetical protein ABIA74_05135 [bacterium]